MIRVNQIKISALYKRDSAVNDNTEALKEALVQKAASLLRISKADISYCNIVKKSIDARKKPDIYYIYTIDIECKNEEEILKRLSRGGSNRGKANINSQVSKAENTDYRFPLPDKENATDRKRLNNRPVIIGSGPAGLFCGYFLAMYGYRPILLERGKPVDKRQRDVLEFWENGRLDVDSNVAFGEGGAGTFSDGKLNTLIKDKNGRNKEVLKIFVKAGAPDEILYEAKPHIGTDILVNVVKNMREEIIRSGGEVRFESKVTDIVIDKDKIKELIVNDSLRLKTDVAVLAIGHSARDTFSLLYERMVPMEAKSFAVGLRVEHPREMIDRCQYGVSDAKQKEWGLPAADYKLTAKSLSGRGVYSFCMCPGGYVVNASSQEGLLAVNGMSYSKRRGKNSNSAIVVTVTPEDFMAKHPLAGISFQQKLEKNAAAAGQGHVPVETYGDFKKAVNGITLPVSALGSMYPDFEPQIKGRYEFAAVHNILPDNLNQAFVEGMESFDKIIPGFADSGVYVSGVESRTSSPVRIRRDESGQSQVKGLYPCGEGAGYAGGITSAAMDGIYIAEKIAASYQNFE